MFLQTHNHSLDKAEIALKALSLQWEEYKDCVMTGVGTHQHGHNLSYIIEQLITLAEEEYSSPRYWFFGCEQDATEEKKTRTRELNCWVYQIITRMRALFQQLRSWIEPIQTIFRADQAWYTKGDKKILLKPYRWKLPSIPHNLRETMETTIKQKTNGIDIDLRNWRNKIITGTALLQTQFNYERMRNHTHIMFPTLQSLYNDFMEEVIRPTLSIQPWKALYLLDLVNDGLKDEWCKGSFSGELVYTGIETIRKDLEDENVLIPEGDKYTRRKVGGLIGTYFRR
jgi:hypothetical protein